MAEHKHHVYLGDGVYASFDGCQIWLTLYDHRNPPLIALDPDVFAKLTDYSNWLKEEAQKMSADEEEGSEDA